MHAPRPTRNTPDAYATYAAVAVSAIATLPALGGRQGFPMIPMTGSEAAAIRNKVGLSVNEAAIEFGVAPNVVESWESGRIRLTKRLERELEWRSAVWDRQNALSESDLPLCEWASRWEAEPMPEKMEARTKHLERFNEHHDSCAVCKARSDFVLAKFGPLPLQPLSPWMEALRWLALRVEQWPRWAQPAAWVGMSFGAYSLIKVLFWIPAMRENPRLGLTALLGTAISVSIGAMVGLAYGGFRELKGRLFKRAGT